jgi:hypothetical protein
MRVVLADLALVDLLDRDIREEGVVEETIEEVSCTVGSGDCWRFLCERRTALLSVGWP